MNTMKRTRLGAAVAAAMASCIPLAHATEGGGSSYNPGVENFLSSAAPPPGVYALAYMGHYSSDSLRDNQGKAVPVPGFKIRADVLATRLVWSTPVQVAGGNLAMHAVLPMVDLKVRAAGNSDGRKGLGDLALGSVVAWHLLPSAHMIGGFDLVAPTGSYDMRRTANLGRNYWSVQPTAAASLVDPGGLNADIKVTLTINQTNSDTRYRSGNEFITDFAAGWGLGNGWTVGVGGYLYQQLTADKQDGVTLSGTKGRGLAIGPNVMFNSGHGFFVTAKWTREQGQRNRTQGDQVWIKASLPF